MKLTSDASLQTFNTLRLPGRAEWLAEVETVGELTELLRDPRFADMPRTVLGEGSNVVLAGDLAGLVIRPDLRGLRVLAEDDDTVLVEIAAGESWDDVVEQTLNQGWQGLENLSLIPGLAGAAPYQNIGAYGVELSDLLESVETVRLADGELCTFSRAECGFGYRDSIFKSRCPGEFLITALRVRLNRRPRLVLHYGPLRELDALPATLDSARQVRERVCAVRRAKLPDPAELPNAGSFFKNPVVDAATHDALRRQWPELVSFAVDEGFKVAAGWLLEEAGWKGWRRGDLGMHEHQALVLVNHGRASGAEVLALADEIRTDIRARFGIDLEQEPVVLPRA